MLKKMTVLAMAVGVVAALALPASASASWKHHDIPINQNVQIGLTSTTNIAFRSHKFSGGLNCQVTSAVTFFAGQTTGEITSFTPHPTGDTANCKGEGTLAFCQVHDVTPTNLPWQIHTTGQAQPTIDITHGEIHSQITGAFCSAGNVIVTPGTAIAYEVAHAGNPADGDTVSTVTVEGTASVHTPVGADAAATVHGQFEVEAPKANTYDI